ncbi:type II toxin-antitoxin system HicA family toxin [Merismopedia glauca]|uniref:type II toxin-antitoxin system HicA family toxin n=1 Tax=Merismopedia glauca TaxID=292586 RepID=UPI0011B1E56A|nr:type II toxin-antitoxin system HicA family toxin [Merismopedia glauca]
MQYKHPLKSGTVTIAGKGSLDMPIGTLKSIWRQAQIPATQTETKPLDCPEQSLEEPNEDEN